MPGKLVILDRDGVINHDSDGFVKTPDEWQPIDGSLEAIAALNRAGFQVAVATNQSGVGRGLIDPPTLEAIHEKMRRLVRDAGGDIGRIAYCPHHPDDECGCRKPATGMYEKIGRHFGRPLDGVPIIGDSLRDLEAATAIGGRPILVLTGNGENTLSTLSARGETVEHYPDLAAAVDALIQERRTDA